MKLSPILIMLGVSLNCSIASSASCPNWSPKFDAIKNPEVIREMRSRTDWDSLIEQSGGASAVIAVAKSTILDARSRLQDAKTVVTKLAANESVAQSGATWGQCKTAESAVMAAKCEVLNMQEVILSMEGTIDLATCRAANR